MDHLAREARLQEIADCDEYLARGDEQLAWLCQRVKSLRELQTIRLARRDRAVMELYLPI
jgi:hypothetical protein